MIDPRLLRDQPDTVRASQRARGEDEGLVDAWLAADERRRSAIARYDSLRAEQKATSKQVSRVQGDERDALLAKAKDLAAQVKQADADRSEAQAQESATMLDLSNVVEDGAPAGGEENYVVLEEVGERTAFDYEPRDHLALGETIGAIDVERGAKVSGARFYFLRGVGAELQQALLFLALRTAVDNGFTPMIPPVLVKPEVMQGTGFLGAHADEVYRLPDKDLYLVGTSEVPLAGYHMDEILDADTFPRRYAGWSTCFRPEAGSYGKDTRGIIRVHQFDKVEMFVYCRPEDAHDEHLRLLAFEKEMLAKAELPYRVIDVAAGDLGSSAARKYDCEAWVPSQGRYREVTSTSNCTEFQSRRLNIRYRGEDGRPRYVATLNGTLATTRWIVALLENHQRPDGSVYVPQELRPYLGNRDVLKPVT
ncbi:MAG: serine--tRNA ligase [Streptosporangiales bacterium]|nr:serine--tRNA ligase [Streptosporangiales bacterium]MBO0889905.1 serine--tRNA ligase [Acidothermales bacterium]